MGQLPHDINDYLAVSHCFIKNEIQTPEVAGSNPVPATDDPVSDETGSFCVSIALTPSRQKTEVYA